MFLTDVFASFKSAVSRFLALCLLPVAILITGIVSYSLKHTVLLDWLQQAEWLSYTSLLIAAAIAWRFGRSRLVWLCIALSILLLPSSFYGLDLRFLFHHRFADLIAVLLWLNFANDKGFALRNIGQGSLYFIGALLIGSWLWPVLAQLSSFKQWIEAPITDWLFALVPSLYQWLSTNQLALILLTLPLVFFQVLRRSNNSQITLFLSYLSLVFLEAVNQAAANQLCVILLALTISIAVMRDSFAMAFKDELTGVPSRRALMQYVQSLGRKYCVVMSDIDHFKKFNDTYGHDVGDDVLKLVASKLNQIGGGGRAFRYGGEEFIIIFAGKSMETVIPHVDDIRQVIAEYDIALRAKPRPPKDPKAKPQKPAKDKIVKVTSSFGLAQRSSLHREFSDIMKQADIALYAAKKAGRNCLKVAKQ